MIALWDGPRRYTGDGLWSVVRTTLGGHAGLKTRAPSSPLCTDGVSFLFCQPKSINIDFAKALSTIPDLCRVG